MGTEHLPERRPAGRAPEKAGTAGAPLPAQAADRMGAAFGQDFSEVRVHTDAAADREARAIDAQAFTVDHDIVFAAGGFAPDTEHGERLLAHELGHVVEQRTTGPRLARQPAGQVVTPPQTDRRSYVESAIGWLRGSAEFHGQPGLPDAAHGPRPLVRVEPGAVPGRLTAYLRIRDDAATTITAALGGDQALTADLRAAYRDAVRALLTAAGATPSGPSGPSGPSADELYLRHQQLIHAWAWPTARPDPRRNELLDAVPQAERARVQVDTSDLTIDGLANVFDPNAVIPDLPAHTTVAVAPGVPTGQRAGLANLARFLVTGRPPLLAVNRSTTLRLDVGGKGTYRFTQVQHQDERGRPTGREVLVEHLATLGPERDAAAPGPGGTDVFARHHFRRDASWTDDGQFAQLLGALAVVPEELLARIDGITFARVPTIPGHEARYQLADHTVAVADSAFRPPSLRAFQGPDRTANGFQRLIAHELGHAVDWAVLRGAQTAADARVALRTARAESGARFQGGTLTDALPAREANEFRTAAGQDGGARITAYADHDWREFYAEAFSLHVTDPDTLRLLRPHLYAYFTRHLPAPGRQP
ncbi:DUF4157 domain-containing protein [Kitasatospora aureofaciens]|uniref:eCIS core domain-containing protein n=1 Tax=Kitasatospora aureofaciens TaxID=1894 RepID=UPI003809317B